MTDTPPDHESLAARLLDEDRASSGPDGKDPGAQDRWLEALLDHERVHEQRVRRLALCAWAAVLAFVPLLGISIFMIRMVSDGWTRDAVRVLVLIAGVVAILAAFVALMSTVAWLYRPRTASLAVIERRLAALEAMLRRERRGG